MYKLMNAEIKYQVVCMHTTQLSNTLQIKKEITPDLWTPAMFTLTDKNFKIRRN